MGIICSSLIYVWSLVVISGNGLCLSAHLNNCTVSLVVVLLVVVVRLLALPSNISCCYMNKSYYMLRQKDRERGERAKCSRPIWKAR